MSKDFSSEVIVGWELDPDALWKVLGRNRKEKFRMEPRFNRKTGKPEGKEKVVTVKGGAVLLLNRQEYDIDDEFEVFAQALADKVGCSLVEYGDLYNGDAEYALNTLVEGGSCSFKQIEAAFKAAAEVRQALLAMGLKFKEATLMSVDTIA